MFLFIIKLIISAVLIATASWLAGKKPILAGFIIALPLTSILALLFNYFEFRNTENTVLFAKSIAIAVPLSLTFFVPFFFAEKWNLSFVNLFLLGIAFLTISYFIHQLALK